ncbi:MAG: DUF4386 domain-containing protein [Roseateles sp.]
MPDVNRPRRFGPDAYPPATRHPSLAPPHLPPAVSPFELRLAGLCYLAIIALGLWTETQVSGSLVVAGDAAATAQRIAAQSDLWRLGIAADLLMQLLDLPVIVVMWRLLRPVNEMLALTATGLNLVQTAVLVANRVQLLAALAMLAVQLHGQGFGIGLLFFAVACLIRGALIAASGVLPRVLGWGLAYGVDSLALLLAPSPARLLFPAVLLPAFVAELALALWLVLRPGARAQGG